MSGAAACADTTMVAHPTDPSNILRISSPICFAVMIIGCAR
jgi:hypothetical protein